MYNPTVNVGVGNLVVPSKNQSYVGERAVVTGSGRKWTADPKNETVRNQDKKLRFANATIWSNEECAKVYNKVMPESILCARVDQHAANQPEGICNVSIIFSNLLWPETTSFCFPASCGDILIFDRNCAHSSSIFPNYAY